MKWGSLIAQHAAGAISEKRPIRNMPSIRIPIFKDQKGTRRTIYPIYFSEFARPVSMFDPSQSSKKSGLGTIRTSAAISVGTLRRTASRTGEECPTRPWSMRRVSLEKSEPVEDKGGKK